MRSVSSLIKKASSALGLSEDELMARVKVSAAAPELLAALQRVVDFDNSVDGVEWDRDEWTEYRAVIEQAKAAIAKAGA